MPTTVLEDYFKGSPWEYTVTLSICDAGVPEDLFHYLFYCLIYQTVIPKFAHKV